MYRLTAICLIVLLSSHASMGVILRPSWFPYFRRPNPNVRVRENQGYSGSERGPEALNRRQTRSYLVSSTSPDYPCKDGISFIDCFVRLLHIVNAVEDQEIISDN